jgi:hypothetical protein
MHRLQIRCVGSVSRRTIDVLPLLLYRVTMVPSAAQALYRYVKCDMRGRIAKSGAHICTPIEQAWEVGGSEWLVTFR